MSKTRRVSSKKGGFVSADRNSLFSSSGTEVGYKLLSRSGKKVFTNFLSAK